MVTVRGDLVTAEGIRPGWVRVVGDRIEAVGTTGTPDGPDVIDTHGLVLPGLVDVHCHGALGAAFGDGAPAVRAAAGHHHRSGTTTLLTSLVSESHDVLVDQVRSLTPLVRDGVVDGIHLEGPYLAARCRGAHRADALRDPDPQEIAELLGIADGSVTVVTIAPELPGARALIGDLAARGVRVAVGHTAASTSDTRAAIDAGARVATHLFNGMSPLHHRDGGPVVALMDDERVVCELIADGFHLDADVFRWAWRVLGPSRRMLVSDSSPATGMADGIVSLGGQQLRVSQGRVQTADGSLAGSASTLLDIVRRVVAAGIPVHDSVTAATAVPAAALGLTDRGALLAGHRADLVLADRGLRVDRVMRGGRWL
jgi:N-acetylglucosamine-6-phosphate deacetylase